MVLPENLHASVAVLRSVNPKHAKHWAKQPIIDAINLMAKQQLADKLTAISFKAVMHWQRPVLASKFSRLIVTTGEELSASPTSWE